MASIVVRAPASTSNLGPGFDCLGLALDIYNTVIVEVANSSQVIVKGEGEGRLSADTDNLVYQAISKVYNRLGRDSPVLRVVCDNRIPLCRGLGSSAAAAGAGLLLGNILCGKPLSVEELLEMGVSLEGHPDNIVPTFLGGCRISVMEMGRVINAEVPLPEALRIVLFIPDFEMPTQESRALLPQQVNRADVVFNLGRVALLTLALSTGQLEWLRLGTQDRLHQPIRQTLFPAMKPILSAALEAKALGAFLSGGGSTLLALVKDGEQRVAKAMEIAAQALGVSGRTIITRPTATGVHQVKAKDLLA